MTYWDTNTRTTICKELSNKGQAHAIDAGASDTVVGPAEPKTEDPVAPMPLTGLIVDSLGSLGAAFSELHVRTPEGKVNEKDTGEEGAEDNRVGEHVPTYDVSSGERPSESGPGATKHPTASSAAATTLRATHSATFSPTITPPVADGTCFTGMPYRTRGVEPLATEPPVAHLDSEPLAPGSFYSAIHARSRALAPAARKK